MKVKNYIILIAFLLIGGVVSGQKTLQPKGQQYEYKGIVYNKERAYNFTIHTNGFRFGMDFGSIQTYYKTRYYHVSIGHLKHRAEERQNKNINLRGFGSSRAFIFGKQNHLYTIRGGVGVKRYLSEKAKRKGIAVGWNYELGPVLGILRPYEIIVSRINNSGTPQPVAISYESDPETFLEYYNIYGGNSFFSGWNNLGIRPGLQAKLGAHFSLGAFDKYVRAFEFGFMVDYFFTKVPIIVENEIHENQAMFFNLYVTLQLGSRT